MEWTVPAEFHRGRAVVQTGERSHSTADIWPLEHGAKNVIRFFFFANLFHLAFLFSDVLSETGFDWRDKKREENFSELLAIPIFCITRLPFPMSRFVHYVATLVLLRESRDFRERATPTMESVGILMADASCANW